MQRAGHRRLPHQKDPDATGTKARRDEAGGAAPILAWEGGECMVDVREGDWQVTTGFDCTLSLMKKAHPPSAIFCANDLMAIGAIDCARVTYGIDVPSQLSIVGFDGVAPAMWASYRLSTVRQPVRRMTEAAVSMLMERIEDPELPPEVRTFAGKFIEGASARLEPGN